MFICKWEGDLDNYNEHDWKMGLYCGIGFCLFLTILIVVAHYMGW